jgi:hypothetical protein
MPAGTAHVSEEPSVPATVMLVPSAEAVAVPVASASVESELAPVPELEVVLDAEAVDPPGPALLAGPPPPGSGSAQAPAVPARHSAARAATQLNETKRFITLLSELRKAVVSR